MSKTKSPSILVAVESSPPTKVCRACGTEFAAHALGADALCLGCLFDAAVPDPPDATAALPTYQATLTSAVVPASVGPCFAQYEIAAREDGSFVELGRGGMGVTYRALDTTLRCDVALKVVNPTFVQDARVRARFLREAQAAAGLRHPHVASVFFFGERPADGQLFYAMELVEGETLHARVRRSGGLPASTVLEIGAQVADALAAAESRGLTHRDLKPANLMLVEGAAVNIKVIDFGLAKAVAEGTEAMGLTGTQEFVGTPAFASPEHFNVWQEVDARSDFYALGATLWYALTGDAPFPGRTPDEIRQRQLKEELPLDQLRAARVPPPLVVLLCTLLSADPAGRPQTTGELAEALEGCRRTPRRQGTRRLAVAAGGILALLVAWWARSHDYPTDLAHQNALLQRQASAQQEQLDALQAQLQQQTQLITLVNAKLDRNAASGSVALISAQVETAQERGIDVETLQRQLAGEQADVRALLVRIDQGLTAVQTNAKQWQELKRAALTRLGDGEFAAGHYAAAGEPYRQALALADANTSALAWCDAAGHLAAALVESARYAEAAPLVQQVAERHAALQGPEHPDTLKAIRSQARLLFEQGSLTRSEALYRQVLEAQERVLGREDRETLKTLNSLSDLPAHRGQNAEAEALSRRCVQACERTLGREDRLTLESTNTLAYTLYTEGRYAEAAALYRRCAETEERLLGTDHPLTLLSVNNLANALEVQGDQAGAESLYRRALAAEERTQGPGHPATLRVVSNLAIELVARGDLAGAEPLYRRALEGQERALGPDHPETLSSLSNLAQLLDAKGDLAAAEPLYVEAQARVERDLAPQDNVRVDQEHYFSLFREKQGRLTEALALAAQAAEGCRGLPQGSPLRRTYEEHFSTLQSAVQATAAGPLPSP